MSQAKKVYDALVESGELTTLFTSMTGEWEKDKNSFTRQFEETEKLINGSSVIDLDDIDEFTEEF